MKLYLLFSIIITFLIVSCENKSGTSLPTNENIETITISCEKNQILNLSDFADSLEIIPLETCDNNLIGWVRRIVSTDENYYISSAVNYYTQKLFVFDKDGKFIRQIGQEGESPRTYSGMNDFVLTDDSIIKISENWPLIVADLVKPTIKDKPTSSKQAYRLTDKARDLIRTKSE